MILSATHLTALVALLSAVSAHVVMTSPIPYHLHTPPLLQVDPLRTMEEFPCQFGVDGSYTDPPTKVAAGSKLPVSFQGSAVHTGGSCQFAVSEKMSADPKDWKVIHSIIGGCPATADGNLPNGGKDGEGRITGPLCPSGNGTECLKTFTVPIPKELNGKYHFSWTWINRSGNREMYMNCAPIDITDGQKDDSFVNSLPSLFIANIGQQKPCITSGMQNLVFPDPGKSVLWNYAFSHNPIDAPGGTNGGLGTCGGTPAAMPQSPSGSGADFYGPPVNGQQAGGSPQSPAPPGPPAAQAAAQVPPAGAAPAPQAPPAGAAPAPPAPQAPPPAAGSPCQNPCSTPGAIVCLPDNSFGTCDHGCAQPQKLAAGTTCSDGKIQKRSTGPSSFATVAKRAASTPVFDPSACDRPFFSSDQAKYCANLAAPKPINLLTLLLPSISIPPAPQPSGASPAILPLDPGNDGSPPADAPQIVPVPQDEAPADVPQNEAPADNPQNEAPVDITPYEAPAESPPEVIPADIPPQELPAEIPQQEPPTDIPQDEAPAEVEQNDAPVDNFITFIRHRARR